MAKISLATIWLDGCSGCHMSFLDMDERFLDLAGQVDILFSPLVDNKVFPNHVDVTLVEGAVSNDSDKKNIAIIRQQSGIVVAFGDCAITANVPGMRNRYPVEAVLQRAYIENAAPPQQRSNGQPSKEGISFHTVPQLARMARPIHECIPVDFFLPGCPPPPQAILYLLTEILAGRTPQMHGWTRFGA